MELGVIAEAKKGNLQAIEEIINEYRPLIKKWIYKYRFTKNYGMELEDLEQIGMCALYNALMHYDTSSKTALQTYAYSAVRYAILTEIRNHQRVIGKDGYLYLEDISYEDDNGNKIHYEEMIAGDINKSKEPIVVREHNPETLQKLMYKDSINAAIIDLLSKGYNRKQISEILKISIKEVYNRIYRMRKKSKS